MLALPGWEQLQMPPGTAATVQGPFTQAQWRELWGGTGEGGMRLLVAPELLGLEPLGSERLRYVA